MKSTLRHLFFEFTGIDWKYRFGNIYASELSPKVQSIFGFDF